MTNPTSQRQQHRESPVNWPVLYRGDDLLAEGTVLDLTPIGWRVAGSMPVASGMRLTLQLWVPDKPEPIHMEGATVLWVKECEFAIEAGEMTPTDQAWVTEFLNRKLTSSRTSQVTDQQASFQTYSEDSLNLSTDGNYQLPRCEDIMRMFSMADLNMKEVEAAVVERAMEQHDCTEEEAGIVYDRFLQEIWQPARRIYNGMVARKAQRDVTGDDAIANN